MPGCKPLGDQPLSDAFSPMGWISAAIRAGMAPVTLIFADGTRRLGVLGRNDGPPALDDRQCEWVLSYLMALGRVREVPMPFRTFPPPAPGAFDPLSWIEQAIYAGHDPKAWIWRDGQRSLACYEANANIYLRPPLLTDADRGRVIDELIRMGRWKKLGASCPH